MNDIEKRFRDRVGESLEQFCPNDSVLNNLSTYLIREVIDTLNESGIVIEGFEKNHDVDRLAFLHAVKDLSLFSAQTVMIQVLRRSFTELRNIVPIETRNTVLEKSNTSTQSRASSTNSSGNTVTKKSQLQDTSPNEMSFNIDLSNIPKFHKKNGVMKQEQSSEERVRESDTDKNVFKGNVEFDIDEINQRTVSSKVSFGKTGTGSRVRSTTGRKDSTDDEFYEDLRTDASVYTGETYSSVPNITIDDDY